MSVAKFTVNLGEYWKVVWTLMKQHTQYILLERKNVVPGGIQGDSLLQLEFCIQGFEMVALFVPYV